MTIPGSIYYLPRYRVGIECKEALRDEIVFFLGVSFAVDHLMNDSPGSRRSLVGIAKIVGKIKSIQSV